MRNLAITLAITPFILLTFVSLTNAQSSTSLQAELNALLAQLAALQTQLQATTGTANAAPAASGSVYGACPNLTRSLRLGVSGSDVTALQAFLAADSRIYPEGTISGYYGNLTQKAVQALQERHNLVTSGTPDTTGFGMVGPATRNLIASLCSGGSVPTTPSVPSGSCTLDGFTVANSATADFYSVATASGATSCASYKATRQCINGNFSGNAAYRYRSCGVSPSAPGACSFNGVVMANGESRTFYRQEAVGTGQSCQGNARTCVNGIVGGSNEYPYPSCGVTTGPVSCLVDGVVIQDGQSVGFYKQNKVLFGQSCAAFQGTRGCQGGVLTGNADYRYASCSVAAAGSCAVGTTTMAHAQTKDFYSRTSVSYQESCSTYKQSRTCTDGVISGSGSYQYPTCAQIPAKTCTVDGVEVAHGASHTFYTSTVPTSCSGYGCFQEGRDGNQSQAGTCASISQSRTCTDGTLSGTATYQYGECAPVGERWCKLGGVYVAHNANRTFYVSSSVPFGQTCAGQSRTCTDGTMQGSAAYTAATCTVAAPASCTLDGVTVNHNQTYTFYSRRTPLSGSICAEYAQARTCTDGTLSGSSSFGYSSCSNSTSSMAGSQVAAALSAMEALLRAALERLNTWF